ncbi:hypothetical protein [Enterococcus sp. DIV0756]|uniref:hypothetical protein n=1 Tax=Enterococcus sp. DIV0756 TaxID=2774636 RepID=UPI003F213D2C
MERYGWMIILAVIGAIALISFFFFLFGDLEKIKLLKKSRIHYLLNASLFLIASLCIVLAIYLYFDIQEQVRILGNLS